MALPDGLRGRNESWRRIRVGLTGLGGILLLIGLASAMLEQLTPNQTPIAAVVSGAPAKSADAKSEPLAELGVAPGAATPSDETAPPKK
jgi:hypothetical protein